MNRSSTPRKCRCGTRLARDNSGHQCGACLAKARDLVIQPPDVSAEFWIIDHMQDALATWNMGRVIAAYRSHPYHVRFLPQEIVAGWVGITQAHLSRIENGVPLKDLDKLIHWARTLRVPAHLLWFKLPEPDQEVNESARSIPAEDYDLAIAPNCRQEFTGLDDMNRREVLRLMSMAGALMAASQIEGRLDWARLTDFANGMTRLDPVTGDEYPARKRTSLAPSAGLADSQSLHSGMARLTPDTLQDLDQLIGRYQVLYHSVAPAVLLTPVMAHLDTVRDLLRQAPDSSIRRTLLVNRARVATLAGRLAFFDLRDPMAARGYFTLGLEAATEATDHHQAAIVLGHISFIPAADHGFAAAGDYLRGATQQLQRCPHGLLASWLAAVESELHTNAGSHSAALGAIDKAREALAKPGVGQDLPWFDYYDEARLAGFAGYTSLRAGQFGDARTALTEALGRLPLTAVKQRAVFLTDLAAVHLRDGDLGEACWVAGDAAEQLRRAGYATGFGRLREFRATVEPWKTSRPVRTLDDRLAAIA